MTTREDHAKRVTLAALKSAANCLEQLGQTFLTAPSWKQRRKARKALEQAKTYRDAIAKLERDDT